MTPDDDVETKADDIATEERRPPVREVHYHHHYPPPPLYVDDRLPCRKWSDIPCLPADGTYARSVCEAACSRPVAGCYAPAACPPAPYYHHPQLYYDPRYHPPPHRPCC